MQRFLLFIRRYAAIGLLSPFFSLLHAETLYESGTEQVQLVELYTSEGCSSCPPAERWMTRLKSQSGLWEKVVPVALHVDYWNYLGWADPYANGAFTDRQRAYARLGSGRVYTPGFFVNGKEWRGFFEGKSLTLTSGSEPGNLRVSTLSDNQYQVEFTPTQNKTADYRVFVAVLGMDLKSKVKAGENRGRELQHDFIALELVEAPLKSKGELHTQELSIPAPKAYRGKQLAMAVWITQSGNPFPIQATGGFLRDYQ